MTEMWTLALRTYFDVLKEHADSEHTRHTTNISSVPSQPGLESQMWVNRMWNDLQGNARPSATVHGLPKRDDHEELK